MLSEEAITIFDTLIFLRNRRGNRQSKQKIEPGFATQRVAAFSLFIDSMNFEVVCKNEYRLCRQSFDRLASLLSSKLSYDYLTHKEIVAIGMNFLAHGPTVHSQCVKFGLSNGPIVKARCIFMDAVIASFGGELSPQFWTSQGQLTSNAPPQFPGCFGAIDGTHIPIRVSTSMAVPYRNRKGNISVNTLLVCDFSRNFLYCYTGFEGSAHDARVFQASNMPRYLESLPGGLYLLADAAYPCSHRVLTPYRGQRYHLGEYAERRPTTPREMFNLQHASRRSVIERTIGIWKRRFAVLRNGVDSRDVNFHNRFVLSCCLLHNFLNKEAERGYIAGEPDSNDDGETDEAEAGGDSRTPADIEGAQTWRESIANRLWQERSLRNRQ